MNVHRDRDRLLQLLILNEEFLVNASHQLALITSLPFVHTARRTYRSKVMMSPQDRELFPHGSFFLEFVQILAFRGR